MRNVMVAVTLASAVLALMAPSASAESAGVFVSSVGAATDPGELDRTFSGDGVRYVDFGRYDHATAVFPAADGRIVLAGRRQGRVIGPYEIALTRLHEDGRIDQSFGDCGRAVVDPTSINDDGDVAWSQTPDGGFVVVGDRGDDAFYLARFDSRGALVRSFGDGGMVLGRFGGDGAVKDAVVLPSGRILVAASVVGSTHIRAYRADGTRATSFGTDGRTRLGAMGDVYLLVQPSGRIVAAGSSRSDERFVAEALSPNGARDLTFGDDGRSEIAFGPSEGFSAWSAAVMSDGAIVVAGEKLGRDFHSDALVARFTADGHPDTAFGGGDARRRIDVGNLDAPDALVEGPGGSLFVVGSVRQDIFGDDPSADLFIVALRADGRYWRAFGGGDGVVRTDFGRPDDMVAGIDAAIIAGKLIVVGSARTDMFAARVLIDPE